ncbi:MAG: LysR family transcriptional regulator [Desulfobacula sp.]|jgi:DNA-binding transcriptional LysR family regulator|nr:LysR family transcriptional regulator [Desulfobacula sp.]
MLLDFNKLKTFYFIFKNKSVVAAAKELNITPSAVSQALTKLEAELNISLFTRLHKSLVPTFAGTQLFEILAPFVETLEVRIKKIQQAKQSPFGMIRMGSPIEFGKSYLPGMFASFRKKYPEVIFTMKLGHPSEIFPMIRSGELDFSLVDIYLTRDQVFEDFGVYQIESLLDEKVVMACSKLYYEEEIQGDHSFKNLSSRNFISYQKASSTLRSWFKHHFNKYSVTLNRVLTVDSHQAVVSGIKSDLGMGLVAAHFVRKDIERGKIVLIETSKKAIINKISLVQLNAKKLNLTERTFVDYLKRDIASPGRTKNYFNLY